MSDLGSGYSGGGFGTGGFGAGGFGGDGFGGAGSEDYQNELAHRMALLYQEVPELINDPAVVDALARSATDDETMLNSTKEGVTVALFKQTVVSMQQQDEKRQRAMWAEMSPTRQALLQKAGYEPPKKQSGGFSIKTPDLPGKWDIIPGKGKFDLLGGGHKIGGTGGVMGAAGSVIAAPFDVGNAAVRTVGEPVLGAMNWVGNKVEQPFRASQYGRERDEAEARAKNEALRDLYEAHGVKFASAPDQSRGIKYTSAVFGEDTMGAGARFNETAVGAPTEETRALYEDLTRKITGGGIRVGTKLSSVEDIQDPEERKLRQELESYEKERLGDVTERLGKRKSWLEAFKAADDPERFYNPRSELKAAELLEDDDVALQLAKRIVSEGGQQVDAIGAIAAEEFEPQTPEYQQRVTELMEQAREPKFQSAVRELQFARMSLGSSVADGTGMPPESVGYQAMSATVDVVASFKLDPFMAAGKIRKAQHVLNWGIREGMEGTEDINAIRNIAKRQKGLLEIADGAEDAQQLRTGAGRIATAGDVRRAVHQWDAAELVAKAFKEDTPETWAELRRTLPHLDKGIEDMKHFDNFLRSEQGRGIESADDVFDFYTSVAGRRSLAAGKLSPAYVADATELPRLTRSQLAVAKSKAWWNDALDWTNDKGIELAEPLNADSGIGLIDRVRGKSLVAPARFIKSLSTHVPRGGETLQLFGDDAVTEFSRLVEFGALHDMPKVVRDKYVHDFISGMTTTFEDGRAVVNIATRRRLVRDYLADLMTRAGVARTPDGRQFMEGFVNRIDDQRYAPDDLDLIKVGMDDLRVGVLPMEHSSVAMAIPRLQDVMAATNKVTFTRRALGYIAPSWVDSFMGTYWKPAMLLRIGFIPRAAGEEMFRFILQEGPAAYVRSQAAQIAVRKGTEKFDILGPLKPWGWAFDHLQSRAAGTSFQQTADFIHDRLAGGGFRREITSRTRDIARQLTTFEHMIPATISQRDTWDSVDDEVRLAVEHAQRNPAYASAWADAMGGTAAHNPFDEFTDPQNSTVVVNQLGAIGVTSANVELRPIMSEFGEHDLNEDPAIKLAFAYNANKLGTDPTFGATRSVLRGNISPQLDRELRLRLSPYRFAAEDSEAAVSNLRSAIAEFDPKIRTQLETWARGTVRPTREREVLQNAENSAELAGDTEVLEAAKKGKKELLKKQKTGQEAKMVGRILERQAKTDPALAEVMEALGDLSPRARSLVMSDAKLWKGSADDMRFRLVRAFKENLQQEETYKYARDNERLSYVGRTGVPVARPPAEGMTPMYVPMLSPEAAQDLVAKVQSGQLDEIIRAFEETASRNSKLALDEFLANINPSMVQRALARGTAEGALQVVPVGNWSTTNYDVAEDLTRILDTATDGEVGLRAVGRKEVVDPARVRKAQITNGGDRLLNPERVRKEQRLPFDEYRMDDAQVVNARPMRESADLLRFGPNGLPDPAGQVVMEGATADEAIEDWANVLADYTQMFLVNDDGDVLHEVLEPLAKGKFSIRDVDDIPLTDLPERITAPKRAITVDRWREKIQRWGYNEVIGPALTSLMRRPLYIHNYTVGLKEGRKIESLMRDPALDNLANGIVGRLGFDDHEDLRRAWMTIPAEQRNADIKIGEFRNVISTADPRFADITPQELKDLRQWSIMDDHVQQIIGDVAHQRALNASIPFIDDHRIRSQFSVIGRNLSPFWYAEEQFLKRWGRLAVHSPEAFRRAQLFMGGLRHYGIVEQNEQGEDIITIPMTGPVQQVVNTIAGPLFGGSASIPLSVPMTGKVKYMLPGIGNPAQFSAGPMVSMPLGLLRRAFPELSGAEEKILGDQGAGRSLPEQILPSWANKLLEAKFGDADDPESQVASTAIQAAAMAEAEGTRLRFEAEKALAKGQNKKAEKLFARSNELSLPPDATAEQIEKHKEEIVRWSRVMLVTRATVGFVSPTAPTLDFPDDVRAEFMANMRHLPLEEAVAQFLTDHPEATAYTIFSSETPSGAPLSRSAEALKEIETNSDFYKRYQAAGAWLLPQSDSGDAVERRAFNQQVAMGMRTRKGLDQWWADYKWNEAADEYFESRENYEEYLDSLGPNDTDAKREVQVRWQAWNDAYKKQHPLFAEQLEDPSRKQRRQRVLAEMGTALADPDVPDTPQRESFRVMLDSYEQYQTAMNRYKGDNRKAAREARKDLKDRFRNWGQITIGTNPETATFWRSVIAPSAGLTLDTEEEDANKMGAA